VCVDDDLGSAESTRGFFRKFEQGATMALPLDIRPDADETKACRSLVNEIDPHCAQDLAVAQQQMRKMTGRELVRVVFVISVVRQQGGKDRAAPDGMIRGPFSRRSHGPQTIALKDVGHCAVGDLAQDCQLRAWSVEAQHCFNCVRAWHARGENYGVCVPGRNTR